MKVLASDFDGTLFFKGKFREEDLKQIRTFQAQGNLFGLCTGRPLAGITEAIRESVRCDFMILSSGAQILDGEGRTLYKACIDLETTASLSAGSARNWIFIIRPKKARIANVGRMVNSGIGIDFNRDPLPFVYPIGRAACGYLWLVFIC